ncbi:MAG: hypothetical protein H7196_05005 [candidate division SR1 bacterium]|nr:hypothetical protein [candidate division SR1 bacterium]
MFGKKKLHGDFVGISGNFEYSKGNIRTDCRDERKFKNNLEFSCKSR